MKKIHSITAFAFMFLLAMSVSASQVVKSQSAGVAEGQRHVELFNFGWKFCAGDIAGAEKVDFDDSSWRSLDLPHDFQIEQPWDSLARPARGFKRMSVGWYRKTFQASPSWRGKRVFLDFEGIMVTGDAWLNGQKIGGTDYGYLGFESDVSRYIDYDGPNVLAVRASTGNDGCSRWYTGGGLYRDVHLFLKDSIAIARHGVFISTPVVGESESRVSVQVEIEGMRGKSLPVMIAARILSPDGTEVGSTTAMAPLRSKKFSDEVQLPLITVSSPQLWSCETPVLYQAEVTVSLNGRVLDRIVEPFGIRQLEFSPIFGFRLNGKKVIFKGIANHADLGAVGVAAYETAIEREFKTLKAFGFNGIRTSHNPYSESFLRMADKYGFLIVDELFDKWGSKNYWSGRVPWGELWPTAIPEWVKRDRNHPSVIFWSLGNELQTVPEYNGYQTNDWGITSYRILDVMLKRYDPTRLSTVAMFPAHAKSLTKHDVDFKTELAPPELSTVTDISSHNYRYPEFKRYREICPQLILFQSEAATAEMGKAYYGMQLDSVVGLAYWGGIEYWGESHGWPLKGWNYSFFNHALQPFSQAYFIKSMFSDEPTVHIGIIEDRHDGMEWNDVQVGKTPVTENWNRESGSLCNIVTYTNADEVELFVNGKSQGVKKNQRENIASRNAVMWQGIPYEAGTLSAIARTSGQEVARTEVQTTGKAVALRIEPENNKWQADGMSLQYVWLRAVDSKGRTVATVSGDVTFALSGSAAKIIAVDNGDHQSNELFAGNVRSLHNGYALCILRASSHPGDIILSASVKGFRTVKTKLKISPDIRNN